jgi:hypothetical protein
MGKYVISNCDDINKQTDKARRPIGYITPKQE